MSNQIEYKGNWYLPNSPDKQVSGTLSINENGEAIIELIGSLRDMASEGESGTLLDATTDIILGIAAGGKDITLLGRFIIGPDFFIAGLPHPALKERSPTPQVTRDTADHVFVGVHFDSKDDIRFREISVNYSLLDEWAHITGFGDVVEKGRREIGFHYRAPDSILLATVDDFKIYVGANASGSKPVSWASRNATIDEKTFIRIEFSEEKPLEYCLNIVYQIANFLSFAMLQPVYPLNVTAQTDRALQDVQIFLPQQEMRASVQTEPLFTLDDIKEQTDALLTCWFGKAELLEPIYELYFGTIYAPRMYLYHKFLSLVQAIESYHRRTRDNFLDPIDQHEIRITKILDTISDEKEKKWLAKKLEHSNEPWLAMRLHKLLKEFSRFTKGFIADRPSFVDKVVASRHYLTHYDREKKNQAAEGVELFQLTYKLRLLTEICILQAIGFTENAIEAFIERNSRYRIEPVVL